MTRIEHYIVRNSCLACVTYPPFKHSFAINLQEKQTGMSCPVTWSTGQDRITQDFFYFSMQNAQLYSTKLAVRTRAIQDISKYTCPKVIEIQIIGQTYALNCIDGKFLLLQHKYTISLVYVKCTLFDIILIWPIKFLKLLVSSKNGSNALL